MADRDTPSTVSATPAPSATRAPGLSAGVARALPAVVTILADLPPEPLPEGGVNEVQNIGSGIVISEQGLVLTNYHVIAGAAELRVVLSTGEERPASVVADDSPFQDMALLSIPSGGLRPASLGDSEAIRLGDPVAVIASGLLTIENQVKGGVISGINVDFPRDGIVMLDMLQTDAAVNHGDSGGALVDEAGEVVGLVTTVIRSTPQREVIEGVALAHSVHTLRPAIEAVLTTGANPRPRLGIERLGEQHRVLGVEELPEGTAPGSAVLVTVVAAGSPAEDAGIVPGDVIVGVNGQQVSEDAPFVNLVAVAAAQGDVRLAVIGESGLSEISVTPRPVAAAPNPR
ncbi:MAG: trypsin-like peptidase domain-containing protein [Dehalococcoidia bacterium]